MIFLKGCIQYVRKFGKLSNGHTTGVQFSFHSQRRAMPNNVQTTIQLHSFHIVSKAMLKILQARLQQYTNGDLTAVQAGLEQAEKPEIKLPTSVGSQKKQGISGEKKSTSASVTMLKPLPVWITTNWKILKEMEISLPYLPPKKSACRSRSSSQNPIWYKGLVQNWESSILWLYIATLLI